jgi:hypothetical protein
MCFNLAGPRRPKDAEKPDFKTAVWTRIFREKTPWNPYTEINRVGILS